MSRVHLKVAVFSLAVIGFYTYYANSIPQLESHPPEEVTISEAEATPERLVQLGRGIFFGKGGCAVCHNIAKAGEKGGRAPDLQGIGARAGATKPGMSAKQYLIESLTQPQDFLVPGYPPIMPPANKPPVGLNRIEMAATVAFLESLGGKVDVKLSDIPAEVTGAQPAPAASAPRIPGDSKTGKELFVSKGCVACHKIAGAGGEIGPDLSNVGGKSSPAEITEAIIEPNAKLSPGYPPVMLPDYAQKLTVKELNDLVAYLAEQKVAKGK